MKVASAINIKHLLPAETFQDYQKTNHFISQRIQRQIMQQHLLISKFASKHFQKLIQHQKCSKATVLSLDILT